MNRKYIFPTIILSFALLCSCSTNQAESTQTPEPSPSIEPFDIEAYKTSVKACADEINDATLILYNMAKYENNYWNTLGRKPENLVDAAYEWLEDNSESTQETIADSNESIRSKYKEIILVEVEGKEATEIEDALRGLYDSYTGMYALVTSPDGSINDFVNGINDNVTLSKDCADTLALFLDSES